jgi:hypothetical protein
MPAISTFATALDAELHEPPDGGVKRSTQVIGFAIDDGDGSTAANERLMFLIVDHDGRARLVSAAHVTFTDDKVMPPKYG